MTFHALGWDEFILQRCRFSSILVYKGNATPIKIPVRYFRETTKLTVKFLERNKSLCLSVAYREVVKTESLPC